MKKILVLTTIYPAPDLCLLNNTNVIHYFVREWSKQGYEVKVIFNYPIYNRFLHLIASMFEKALASRTSAYITTKRLTMDSKYKIDGVDVFRFPLYKAIPRTKVSNKNIKKQINKIVESNKSDNFIPDYIVAHFLYPHLEIVDALKSIYKGSKSCIVVHKQRFNLEKTCPKAFEKFLKNIDLWGFRSRSIQNEFENKYGNVLNSFICYSGIPTEFLLDKEKKINLPIKNFVYVGSLIKRKNPETIVSALLNVYNNNYFSLKYVGDGILKNEIRKQIMSDKLDNRVIMLGHLTRDKVQNIISESDCFIMVSKDESYGLVYIEAMAKGCITIASKNEGMDGIIINGINGFLCNEGNIDELSAIIKYINTLSESEMLKISNNARETAQNLTDKAVAVEYLKNLLMIKN